MKEYRMFIETRGKRSKTSKDARYEGRDSRFPRGNFARMYRRNFPYPISLSLCLSVNCSKHEKRERERGREREREKEEHLETVGKQSKGNRPLNIRSTG